MKDAPEQTEHDTIGVSHEEDVRRVPIFSQLALLGVVLLLLLGSGLTQLLPAQSDPATTTKPANAPQTQPTTVAESLPLTTIPEEVAVIASAAFVWDVHGQRMLYAKNPDEQLPLASITKLMTALVAEELVQHTETIPITLSAIRQQGESGLFDGEQFTYRDLLDLVLMTSSNDGAYALAAVGGSKLADDGSADTFVQAMNIKAEELNLTQTYFRNPTGLDISATESGAYSSARDVTFLMQEILKTSPHILDRTREDARKIENTAGAYHESENTNPLVAEIPGLIGSKTGYTDLAGGNLVVAFDVGFNRPVIVTVMGSTRNGRFNDVATLVTAVTTNVAAQ